MKKRALLFGLFLIICVVVPRAGADAQIIGQQGAQLQASPSFPEPFAEVELTLDAYTFDTTGATIRWFVDGVEQSDARNARTMTVAVGDYGQETVVRADIALANGQQLRASKRLTPSRLDVIIEAETYTPLHYKGRALPSSGSGVRAIAIPVTSQNINDLSFKWTLDRQVLYGGPVLGRSVAEFSMPRSGRAFLRVEVADQSGRVLMRSAQYISVADVELHFYEDNALRGLSRIAIQSPYQLIADEVTVRAEPYYFMPDILDPNTHIEWEVNNKTVENPSSDPLSITLRGGGGTGRFTVEAQMRNLDNLLQGTQEDFTVTF